MILMGMVVLLGTSICPFSYRYRCCVPFSTASSHSYHTRSCRICMCCECPAPAAPTSPPRASSCIGGRVLVGGGAGADEFGEGIGLACPVGLVGHVAPVVDLVGNPIEFFEKVHQL